MFKRALEKPLEQNQSFFLLGPRSTGKTHFVKQHVPDAIYLDLLNTGLYQDLLADPGKLENLIPDGSTNWIVIDEIQRVPELLNEVHRLIVHKHYKFILTGSSARSLRKKGVNLLGGRALMFFMHPFIVQELGSRFVLTDALQYGLLPPIFNTTDPHFFLSSYINTYLREEVLQEGLTRNMQGFTKFLEVAAFSQGSVLNKLNIARETNVKRSTIDNYFQILQDLLISYELPVFSKKAKRKLVQHPKFYFFDVGVYQSLKPKGVLDSPEEAAGIALESLVMQSLRAVNDYYSLFYNLYYWRTRSGLEVDFVLYGEKGLHAFEVKRSSKISKHDLKGLKAFKDEYPIAKAHLLYGGKQRHYFEDIVALPVEEALRELPNTLGAS